MLSEATWSGAMGGSSSELPLKKFFLGSAELGHAARSVAKYSNGRESFATPA